MDLSLTGSEWSNGVRFLGLVLIPCFWGYQTLARIRGPLYVGERLLLGMTLGLASYTALCLVGSLLFGLRLATLLLVLLLLATSGGYLLAKRRLRHRGHFVAPARTGAVDRWGLAVFLCSALLFWLLARRLILWQGEGLSTGYLDNWGDLPLHLSLITSFTTDTTLRLQSTILAGESLTYPFMSDFFSATAVVFGLPLEFAVEWPTVLFNSITLTLLFYLSYRLVRDRRAAALVPVLFLLAGGLGFLWFLKDLYLAPRPLWEFLQHLPRRYTNLRVAHITWVNPTLAHLLPQRSFLFGFPMGLSVILLWWTALRRKHPRHAWLSGVLMGLLPLFHTHTFIVLGMLAAMFAALSLFRKESTSPWLRYWLVTGSVALPFAAPQLWYLLSSNVSLNSIRFHVGWMAESDNLVFFWLKNVGLFLPLPLLVLFLHRRLRLRTRAVVFYLPFAALFIIANLVLFAPFPYDNNKVLVFWFILSLPFVAKLLVQLRRSRSWWLSAVAFRTLFISLIFSGTLNLLHEFQNNGWPELTAEEVRLAQKMRQATLPTARFLTAPIHNNFLTLAGRAVVMGYPGHVYSHGLDYGQRQQDIAAIFSQPQNALAKLRQYGVDYIVVGPPERQRFKISDENFASFAVFATSENYVVYDAHVSEVSTQSSLLTHKRQPQP